MAGIFSAPTEVSSAGPCDKMNTAGEKRAQLTVLDAEQEASEDAEQAANDAAEDASNGTCI